jgi:hypothetical protein
VIVEQYEALHGNLKGGTGENNPDTLLIARHRGQ